MTSASSSSSSGSRSELFLPRVVVSGGQTGVDRGALDVAIAMGLGHGGWCPAKRLAEDGSVPSCYDLKETDSSSYPVRTELNVLDSDATLILYERKLKGGTLLTQRICQRESKPHLCVRIDADSPATVRTWLAEVRPEILNVAGPRESSNPGICHRSMQFLLHVLTDND